MAEIKTPQETHIAEEIRELEQALEAKRKALLGEGKEKEQKELFREIFHEQYKTGTEEPAAVSGGGPREGAAAVPGVNSAARHEEEIQTLIQFAFSHGIFAAITRAKKETPWLLDELHDRLVDEYYQKLVASREITDTP